MTLKNIASGFFVWLILAGVCVGATNVQESATVEFVGTTPCDALSRGFLTGAAPNDSCQKITWQLSLTQASDGLSNYRLVATYGIQAPSRPGFIDEGETVRLEGGWTMVKGTRSNPNATVYRITAGNPERSLSFVKVNNNLLHLLNEDKSLMVGNDLWNYVLSRKGVGLDK